MCVSVYVSVYLWASLFLHLRAALCFCPYSYVSVCGKNPPPQYINPTCTPRAGEASVVGRSRQQALLADRPGLSSPFHGGGSILQPTCSSSSPAILDKGPASRPRRWIRQKGVAFQGPKPEEVDRAACPALLGALWLCS